MEAYHSHARPEMLAFVPREARRVLDVGCGEGAFAALVKERTGAEVWGIELDARAAKVAASRLDRVFDGDALARLADVPDGAFDVVVTNDVLEHLVDPYAALRALRAKLAPGGCLVASIPNVRFLPHLVHVVAQKDWRYEDEGIRDRTHLRFFTARSIRRAFDEAGYRIERMQGINPMAGWKFPVFNVATLGTMRDTRWQQFAVVARAVAR